MITARVDVEKGRIEVSGHSEYAPKGEDIVCAAVSALVCTLASLTGDGDIADGYIDWQVYGDVNGFAALWFVAAGLEKIAMQYPDYVDFNIYYPDNAD